MLQLLSLKELTNRCLTTTLISLLGRLIKIIESHYCVIMIKDFNDVCRWMNIKYLPAWSELSSRMHIEKEYVQFHYATAID